jgi:hypothetical protein
MGKRGFVVRSGLCRAHFFERTAKKIFACCAHFSWRTAEKKKPGSLAHDKYFFPTGRYPVSMFIAFVVR